MTVIQNKGVILFEQNAWVAFMGTSQTSQEAAGELVRSLRDYKMEVVIFGITNQTVSGKDPALQTQKSLLSASRLSPAEWPRAYGAVAFEDIAMRERAEDIPHIFVGLAADDIRSARAAGLNSVRVLGNGLGAAYSRDGGSDDPELLTEAILRHVASWRPPVPLRPLPVLQTDSPPIYPAGNAPIAIPAP